MSLLQPSLSLTMKLATPGTGLEHVAQSAPGTGSGRGHKEEHAERALP